MENGDEEMDVVEQISADGVSDEDIGFTNSFEPLNSAPAVRTQSRKKTKINNASLMVHFHLSQG